MRPTSDKIMVSRYSVDQRRCASGKDTGRHKGSAMAHKNGQGSSRNGRDSNPKMRGIKLYGGQYAKPGGIIRRQTGSKWHPGKRVGSGRDWTILSMIEGTVKFGQACRRIDVGPLDREAG